MDETISLRVVSRDGVMYEEGELSSCSFMNMVGPFDVLPQHVQMVTVVEGQIVARRGEQVVRELEIPGGVLRVKGNEVEVYVGV